MTTITHQTAKTQFIDVNGTTFAYRRWGILRQNNLLYFFFNIFVVV
jgi:hypothetical protein